ncbi:MAG TPA: DUF5916 domain-containing protein [Gemmatimonadaceae bacterium]
MLFPLVLAVVPQLALPGGQTYSGRARQLDVPPPRIDTTITIDGQLDEPVWRRAVVLTGFSEYRPADGRPSQDSTAVLVWYAPDAIYFGIRAYEPHGSVVRATLADRDNIDADDRVQILLDTYADHRRALLFAVNPLGVQEDGVWSDGFSRAAGGSNAGGRFDATIDLNPDFVYQSRGHLTSWGYEVEVRIPFKSLHYQSADPQRWGIQVLRDIQHSGHEDAWTPAVRASASFLIQSGSLTGLTGLHRGLVMDITPEFTTKVNGARTPTHYDYSGDADIGGTLRWGVTPNLSAVITAHPDFSQVEADVGQVTANQRFALFYPEKRPFFLEGLEQYDTPNQLIYTRRIVQPVAGAKLTGKIGSTSIAYLGAVDTRDVVTGDNPVFNVLRIRRDLASSSAIGVVYTDRIDGGDYNRVAGADAHIVWKKIWFSQVQVVGSWTGDSAGSRRGALWNVVFGDRTGRAYGNHFELTGITPDFEAASGFVNRTGIVNGAMRNRFTWYGAPGALVEEVSTFISVLPLWTYDDFTSFRGTTEGRYQNQWSATLRGGWNVSATVNDDMQRFDPADYAGYAIAHAADTVPFATPHGLYGLWGGQVSVNTPSRAVTASLTAGYSASPIFAEGAEGRARSVQGEVVWRPTSALRLDALWTHETLDRARDGSRFATADIPRLKLEYQLSRAVFLRYVGQYFSQDQSALVDPRTGDPIVLAATGSPIGAAVVHDFRSDVLFSYRPTPGTVFLLGYGATLDEPNAFHFHDLRRREDGVFLKVSYLFRM